MSFVRSSRSGQHLLNDSVTHSGGFKSYESLNRDIKLCRLILDGVQDDPFRQAALYELDYILIRKRLLGIGCPRAPYQKHQE